MLSKGTTSFPPFTTEVRGSRPASIAGGIAVVERLLMWHRGRPSVVASVKTHAFVNGDLNHVRARPHSLRCNGDRRNVSAACSLGEIGSETASSYPSNCNKTLPIMRTSVPCCAVFHSTPLDLLHL